MYYSTKHKQEKGLASSECCKRRADTATGYWDKPSSSSGGQHQSAQALFGQFEKPNWLNVIHANGAETVARTSLAEVKVHVAPLGKGGEALWCLLWVLYLPTY